MEDGQAEAAPTAASASASATATATSIPRVFDLTRHGLAARLDSATLVMPSWRCLHTLRACGSRVSVLRPPVSTGTSTVPGYTWDRPLAEGSYGRLHVGRRQQYRPVLDATGAVREYAGIRGTSTDVVLKELIVGGGGDDSGDSSASGAATGVPFATTQAAATEAVRGALAEGVIHALVADVLAAAGLADATPVLYEVVARGPALPPSPAHIKAVVLVMEHVRGATLWSHLHASLVRGAGPPRTARDDEVRAGNARLVLDVLVQLAVVLDILHDALRFNHRDLKVNNVMVRDPLPAEAVIPPLVHPALPGPWRRGVRVVLLDYGFACVTRPPTDGAGITGSGTASAAAAPHAGTWFLHSDPCDKPGRDIAQFVYCLHAYFPLQLYLPRSLLSVLEATMVVHAPGAGLRAGPDVSVPDVPVNLLHGVTEDGSPLTPHDATPPSAVAAARAARVAMSSGGARTASPAAGRVAFDAGIYNFLQQAGVHAPQCAPRALLRALAPELIKYG